MPTKAAICQSALNRATPPRLGPPRVLRTLVQRTLLGRIGFRRSLQPAGPCRQRLVKGIPRIQKALLKRQLELFLSQNLQPGSLRGDPIGSVWRISLACLRILAASEKAKRQPLRIRLSTCRLPIHPIRCLPKCSELRIPRFPTNPGKAPSEWWTMWAWKTIKRSARTEKLIPKLNPARRILCQVIG